MGATRQPFIYEAVKDDDRFPASTFDPKAVTRSSYESQKRRKSKPRPNGPLISVNRHPEYVGARPSHSGRIRSQLEQFVPRCKMLTDPFSPARTWCPKGA